MSSKIQPRVDDGTAEALESLQKDRGMEHKTDAAKTAVRTGLRRYGYLDGGTTRAGSLLNGLAFSTFQVGAVLMVLSWLGSLALFSMSLSVLAASLALVVANRVVVPRLEPRLSNLIPEVRRPTQ